MFESCRAHGSTKPFLEDLTVQKIPQPWFFVVLALGFGIVAYFASGQNLTRGVLGGLLFALLISGWLRVRKRLWRS